MNITESLIAGFIILILDLLVTYIIIAKLLTSREKKRWLPFRQHLYNSLLRSTTEIHGFFDIFTADIEKASNNLSNKNDINEFLIAISNACDWFNIKRNEVFNSIQTTAPSISENTSKEFTNIFRYLDNNLTLTSELGYKVNLLFKELKDAENQDVLRISQLIKRELPPYNIKMLGGFGYYRSTIEEIISKDNFRIVNGEALTTKEIANRERIANSFDRFKRDGS